MQMDALGALVVVVAVFLIAAILELDNRGIRDSEKEDFRRRTTDELPDVLDQLISNSMCPRILYSNWLRPERFKTETLDSESYGALRKFYDSVKTRNEYFSSRHMVDPQHVQKLNRSIIDAFFEICTRVSWLRESIGSGRIDDLRSRIEHTALL
jgi:uncharacterized protein YfkK (UPF0435 family)